MRQLYTYTAKISTLNATSTSKATRLVHCVTGKILFPLGAAIHISMLLSLFHGIFVCAIKQGASNVAYPL